MAALGRRVVRYNSLLAVLLLVKHATRDFPCPFVTDHDTIVMLIADLFAYALTTVKLPIIYT
ncbi:hypothetical protein DVH24_037051 [Malus domestica]|uniref:Uncharacterized protein n=1 Tax=Malus domestica TaxID=3750 RepID=A0A498HIQ1_MALDO|nr:hypothetical protein DVH24_037051 [Malus domestica]